MLATSTCFMTWAFTIPCWPLGWRYGLPGPWSWKEGPSAPQPENSCLQPQGKAANSSKESGRDTTVASRDLKYFPEEGFWSLGESLSLILAEVWLSARCMCYLETWWGADGTWGMLFWSDLKIISVLGQKAKLMFKEIQPCSGLKDREVSFIQQSKFPDTGCGSAAV